MAAHMFVMYNGILSMITPPVAFAAYAAANIARTDGWTTGWIACVVGWSTFLLPFLFVLTPSLLMDGSWTDLIVLESHARHPVRHLFARHHRRDRRLRAGADRPWRRGSFMRRSGVWLVVLPPEAFASAVWINLAGIATAIVLLTIDWLRLRKQDKPAVATTPY